MPLVGQLVLHASRISLSAPASTGRWSVPCSHSSAPVTKGRGGHGTKEGMGPSTGPRMMHGSKVKKELSPVSW